MKGDSLGDRMKEQYENRTRLMLPRRTYTIIRVDGKAFHTFTKGCKQPYDKTLMDTMDETAKALCHEIQGAKFAYVQSDEISVLLTDFAGPTTSAWFDGNVQKMTSIAAAIATRAFNQEWQTAEWPRERSKLAMFDARVFTIPDPIEVENYFIWRQQDATRNSIQMAARAVFSHKECENMDCNKLQDMMMLQKNINWNNYTCGEKRGRMIVKETYSIIPENNGPEIMGLDRKIVEAVERTRWISLTGEDDLRETPIFTQEREWLKAQIPRMT